MLQCFGKDSRDNLHEMLNHPQKVISVGDLYFLVLTLTFSL